MVFICGADKGIRLDMQWRPGLLKKPAYRVSIFFRWYVGSPGSLGNLVAVFIRPGLKAYILPAELAEAAVGVRYNCRISMPQVRPGIHIIYGCC